MARRKPKKARGSRRLADLVRRIGSAGRKRNNALRDKLLSDLVRWYRPQLQIRPDPERPEVVLILVRLPNQTEPTEITLPRLAAVKAGLIEEIGEPDGESRPP